MRRGGSSLRRLRARESSSGFEKALGRRPPRARKRGAPPTASAAASAAHAPRRRRRRRVHRRRDRAPPPRARRARLPSPPNLPPTLAPENARLVGEQRSATPRPRRGHRPRASLFGSPSRETPSESPPGALSPTAARASSSSSASSSLALFLAPRSFSSPSSSPTTSLTSVARANLETRPARVPRHDRGARHGGERERIPSFTPTSSPPTPGRRRTPAPLPPRFPSAFRRVSPVARVSARAAPRASARSE